MLEVNMSPNKFLPKNNKRLSKVPIIIIFAIIAIVLFSIFYVALSRKQNLERQTAQTTPKEETQIATNHNNDLNLYIDELQVQKAQENNVISPPMPNATQQPIQETNSQTTQQPPNNTPILVQNNAIDEKEMKIKKDMQLKALLSNTKLDIKTEATDSKKNQAINFNPPNNNEDINLGAINPQNTGLGLESGTNKDVQGQQFLSQKKDNGYLKYVKQKPLSTYEIKAGWNIPAILITGVNSDLPGQILAQVTQNVYDSATGKYLLIPQGTKVVGAYSSNIIYGQSRLLVAWNKLIFPNGDTLNLDGMQGTSQDGYTGFEDQVDNHYFRIFGSAFLLSSISAGIALSDNSDTNSEKETASDKAIAQAIQQMGQVASEMIRKNMNISPTLKIRPGYKFNIFVTKDIILEPLELNND
ncbi:conjugal transfer protein TrbI [Campylobacter coli]|uniref:Conjugal transfer protein TrbI n=1 Tax=Campylobacter coli TaxID=195 RepID=A0A5T0J6I5_CAMCO|nr:TrbI/VirB10 family protein [Campylobacter coli]EAJ6851249.1 conjugal transfer protein TrbI [Campylobacter jejuni]EAK5660901.1 conjugal transfer protein TrbI [Campylobacter fetus]EIA77549.1 conjugal transfer protein TrbI [Campylobacter coli 132-6]AGZ22106.1 conjugal transfer protein TrbI [Campylobacter coli 15-537360]AJW59147.1 Type IV secretion system protein virB10 [Campylobacter coli]